MNSCRARYGGAILTISGVLNLILACMLFSTKPEGSDNRRLVPISAAVTQRPTPAKRAEPVTSAGTNTNERSPAPDGGLRANLDLVRGHFLLLDQNLKLSKVFASAYGLDASGASRMEGLLRSLYSRQLEIEKQSARIRNETNGDSYYQIPPYDGALNAEVAELVSAITELAGPDAGKDLPSLLQVDYRSAGMFYNQEIALILQPERIPSISLSWKNPGRTSWLETASVYPVSGPEEKFSHRVVDRFSHLIDFSALFKLYAPSSSH